ncbi:MAG: hypothetical protein U0869_14685 [Chloroflexota bacterium]
MTALAKPDLAPLERSARAGLSAADAIGAAVLRTLAYADVFDFALREPEVHRYLIGVRATPDDVAGALADLRDRIVCRDGLVALTGREALLATRQERRAIAARTWPHALRYARTVGSLPFVRMVGVTGALAVGNATEGADIDLLIVAATGRVWTARAATIGVVRLAARRGIELCPNYVIAERRLEEDAQDLYAAHELAQLVPVTGFGVYRRLLAANPWVARHLPNAAGAPFGNRSRREPVLHVARSAMELALHARLGAALEGAEQRRKIPRLTAQAHARGATAEAAYTADRCKGHVHGHADRIRDAYKARVTALGLEPGW